MASFDKHTPILRRRAPREPNVRWLLWPVFAWRIVAPVRQERRLNLFQRATLGLARARVHRVGDVAERLSVDPELVAVISQELQERRLLDHAGVPTARGLDLLEEIDVEALDELRVGHVLADPFTGKLWPCFLSGDLPLADVEPDDEGWPVLLSGSAGDPRRDRAFSVPPGRGEHATSVRPSRKAILDSLHRHGRAGAVAHGSAERERLRLKRISFVDEDARPYLVALCVRSHPSGDWMVDEPFGSGEAHHLREGIEGRLDGQPGLRRWLGPLVGGTEDTPTLPALQERAAWDVEERLTLAIKMHADVRERLVEMQRSWLEASGEGAPSDKWDDVLLKAQRAVERTLAEVHRRYRPHGGLEHDSRPLHAALSVRDRGLNRERLNAAAGRLGFEVPLPKTLSSVRGGKVRWAETDGTGSLRPFVLLTLLCADRYDGHPLRRAAPTCADFLQRLDALASARDRAAHGAAARRPERMDRQVAEHVETTYLTVEYLLMDREGTGGRHE